MWMIVALALAAQGGAARDGWTAVRPGGETGCAFGEPFEFWVREADPSRVMVFLQGGGACWSAASCAPGPRQAFDAAIDSADFAQRRDGIFDAHAAANPFRGYTTVFVPYCTGDAHLGTRTVRYPADTGVVTVRHRGFYNAESVLAWLAARRRAPATVVVVGASAGAIASPIVAAEVAARLPRARVVQIGDAVAGLRIDRARALIGAWGVDSLLAARGMPLPDTGDVFVAMYRAAAARAPRVRFAQVAKASDAVVGRWLSTFGGDSSRVRANIEQTYRELAASHFCFSGFMVPGTEHTFLWRADFLATRVGSRLLAGVLDEEVVRRPCATTSQSAAPAAAMLFAYRPKAGSERQFHEAYRRHLAWHQAHNDSLVWYGWEVASGPRLGLFVDGTFGLPFAAFDQRVEPAADAADFAASAGPLADATGRWSWELRPELGTGAPLESWRPSPMIEVTTWYVRPGAEARFEAVVRRARSARDNAAVTAWYRVVNGDAVGAYVQMVFRERFADWDAAPVDLPALGDLVTGSTSELWRYLPESSLIPDY